MQLEKDGVEVKDYRANSFAHPVSFTPGKNTCNHWMSLFNQALSQAFSDLQYFHIQLLFVLGTSQCIVDYILVDFKVLNKNIINRPVPWFAFSVAFLLRILAPH